MLVHPTHMWRIDTDLNAVRRHGTKMSHRNQSVVLIESQYHIINSTNPRSALNNGIQHGLHVRRRPADDAKHLGGGRLMLQRLTQFRVTGFEICSFMLSSWNRRTFSMAITAWSAKIFSRAICLSVNGRTSVRRIVITPIGVSSRSNGVQRIVLAPVRC